MKIEEIVKSAGLVFPDDIVLQEPKIVSAKLRRKSRMSDDKLAKTLLALSKQVIASDYFREIMPSGLEEPTVKMMKILVTTRWANYIETVKPSLTTISDLSNISRNVVSPCVRFLDVLDLINVRSHMRSQLISPTRLTTLFINAISGDLRNEHKQLREIVDAIRKGRFSRENMDFLENLETAFHIAKRAYNEDTMNYEIVKDLHSKVRELVVKAEEGKNKEFIRSSVEFMEMLEHITKTREKAMKLGLKPSILEDTGEKLGRAKVFRIK